MTATVTPLRQPKPGKAPKLSQPAKSSRIRGRIRRQAMASAAVGAVGLVLTGLSLSHLSHGVALATGVPQWEAWSMAIGIDLGFIGLECAQLCAATETVRKTVSRYARPSIIATLAGSAVMNAFAFASGAVGWLVAPAIALGLAIPALIYVLTRIAVAMWIDCQR